MPVCLWYNCLTFETVLILNGYSLILLSFFFPQTLQGPLICVYFRNVRMHKKGVSCLLLCLCSFSTCPHSQTSPVWCYKTSKGLFNVCSRLLCQSSVSEWGATRHRRLCTPCHLTHTSSGCVLVLESTAATAVQPLSVCSPFLCMQTKHTYQMLAYPYKDIHRWFAYLYILPEASPCPQNKLSTHTNITLTNLYVILCQIL